MAEINAIITLLTLVIGVIISKDDIRELFLFRAIERTA